MIVGHQLMFCDIIRKSNHLIYICLEELLTMTMESLMSHILTSASARLNINKDLPLDLTWNMFTKHTCDRFVNQEDLRSECVQSSAEEEKRVESRGSLPTTSTEESSAERRRSWYVPSTTSYSSANISTCDSSYNENTTSSVIRLNIKQDVSIPLKESQRPHPFSVESLIGNTDSKTDNMNACTPAQVSSSYVHQSAVISRLQYESFVNGLHNYQHVSILSPIRSIPLLRSRGRFWCHVCNALCMDKEDADRHQYTHRLQRSKCNLRRRIFNEKGFVTAHEHVDDDKMKCGLCDKVVANCFFTKHQRIHDGHFCDICDHEFCTNSRLQDHMNIHNGNTPFSCTLCDRQFAKRSSLTQHQRYHRDHRSFKCQYCGKHFNSKYACAVHERLHTGENPFKCDFPGCKRAFPQKIQLQLHMNSHRN